MQKYQIRNNHDKVLYILENYMTSRDDDITLQMFLAAEFCAFPYGTINNWQELFSVIRQVPNLNDISRIRRKITVTRTDLLTRIESVAINRRLSIPVWQDYNRHNLENDGKLPLEYIQRTPFDNYPSHMTPSEIVSLDI